MFRVINIYIFKEVALPFFLSLLILTVTALLSKVIKIVELMVTHGIGISFVFWFIVSIIPSFLIFTIPISFLTGVLVAFTRLSSDSEITAMKAGGLSLFDLMKPVLALGLIAYAVTLSFTLYIYPWGNMTMKQLLFDAARTRLVSGLDEKTFYDRFKGVVLYVDHLNPKTGEMEGIFISERTAGEKAEPNVFFAAKGVFAPSSDEFSVYLKLFDGTIHKQAAGKHGSYHIAEFSTYVLELNLAGSPAAATESRANRELYPGELLDRIRTFRAEGGPAEKSLADFHKRFALPAAIFVFALLGVPFGIQKVRSSRLTGFSVALTVVLAYYVLSMVLGALAENGTIDPVLSVWGTDFILFAVGAYVLYKAAKDSPVSLYRWTRLFKPRQARAPEGQG